MANKLEFEEMDELVAVNQLHRMYGDPVVHRPLTCNHCGAELQSGDLEHFLDGGGCVNRPKPTNKEK